MGLAGGPEVLFDAEVQLDRTGGEPAAPAGGEDGRLGDLGHAEDVGVVRAEPVLRVRRRGELYVVDGGQHGHASLRATAKMRRNGKTVPRGPVG